MKNKIPDNVVFNEEEGYNANTLSYPTNVGAPVIKIDNILDNNGNFIKENFFAFVFFTALSAF